MVFKRTRNKFDNTAVDIDGKEIKGDEWVRNDEGNLISSAKSSRPRVSNSTENRVGIGFDDGQILIWENDLFNRRSKEEIPEQNSRKSALAAKLRSLRN